MFAKIFKAVIGPSLEPIVDRLIPNREARKEFDREFSRLVEEGAQAIETAQAADRQAQIEVNRTEAAHRNLFVAGWRPAVGWVCALGVAWTFIGHPVALWGTNLAGLDTTLPAIPSDRIMELLIALLGMGTLRTAEKLKGVARKR